jgi:6-phosphofructokinase
MLRPRYLKDFAENDKERTDADKVLAWYDGIRHRAIARQHGCTSFAHDASQGPPIGPLEHQAADIARSGAPVDKEIAVPEDFYSKLLSVDDEAYGRLLLSASSDLRGWWRTGSSDSLKRVVDQVLRADAQAKQRGEGLCEVFGYVTQGAITSAIPSPVGSVAGVVAKVLVTRGAKSLIRAESRQRVVEYLLDRHAAYKP